MDADKKELVDYFIAQTNERFKAIDSKLEALVEFKHKNEQKSATISTVISVSITLLIQAAALLFGK
jgi:hypothetical protein